MKKGKNNVYEYQMLIHGQWIDSLSGKTIAVENPANEEIIATVQAGNADDAVRALESAQKAQPKWAKVPPIERAKILFRIADLLLANKERLAKILVLEQGKLYKTALSEVEVTADFISYAAQAGRRLEGDIYPSDLPNEQVWIQRVPYGVTVGLTAWNFPLALAGRKVGPALITGNTMVLKPPSITPITTLEFANLTLEAGLPPGVLNVVTGGGSEIGKYLVTNPITSLITMTGSTETGKELYRLAAERIKAVRLELGGKAPFILLEDGDIDKAVDAAVMSRFLNCGQVCTCNERMYIHEKVYDEFLEKLLKRVSKLKVGNPMDDDVDIGPKVSLSELEKVEAMVQTAINEGAKLVYGGKRLKGGQYEKGYWFEPTVLTVVNNKMEIMQKEIFGPVIPVMKISDFDQALELANDSEYGLSAFLFTQDMRKIMRAVNELDFGEIYINREMGELRQGFHNGYRLSGIGGEDGKYGIENYLKKKTLISIQMI